MTNVLITRGDAYAIRRPLFTHTLVTTIGETFDLTGCTILTTFKIAPLPAADDPDDESGAIKGTLVVNEDGVATTQDNLFMVGAADDGVIELRLTSEETQAVAANQPWGSDVRIIDDNGEPYTWIFTDTLEARDAYTTRLA